MSGVILLCQSFEKKLYNGKGANLVTKCQSHATTLLFTEELTTNENSTKKTKVLQMKMEYRSFGVDFNSEMMVGLLTIIIISLNLILFFDII